MKMIIVGCGRVGSELAELLDAEGHQVTVIDPESENFQRLEPSFRGRTVAGIGFDYDVLIRAGIEKADALAAVFSNDATNAIVARAAHEYFKVPTVVARLYDPLKADLYEHFGFQTVSSTMMSVHRIEQVMTSRQLRHLVSLGNGQVQMLEMCVPARLAAQPLSSLLVTGEVAIVGLTRRGETFIPSPGALMEENDLVCLSVVTTAIGRLEAMLRHGG